MKIFKNRAKISYSFLFSISLHLLLSFFLFKTHQASSPTSTELKNQMITKSAGQSIKLDSIKFISPSELKRIKESQGKQIVANETNGRAEKPVNSRFAGEKDQTFDRQTMAQTNGIFKEAGAGKKTGSKETLSQLPAETKKVVAAAKKPAMPKKEITFSELGGFKLSEVEKAQDDAQAAVADMARKMEAGDEKASALGVNKGKIGINGLAQSNDFVEDVPLGDMTNLNTTEFKYYGFYHRIRQKLEQHWGSSIKDKAKNLYRSGKRVPASDNLITAVTVILNDTGNIVDIKIEGTSGIRELDQAAIESFNKAGPFPNPPKGLLVGGRATIQWGFVVKS